MKHYNKTYTRFEATEWPLPNVWDAVGLLLVLSVIVALVWGAHAMSGQYHLGQTLPISLSPWMLPYYALRSVFRMLIAMLVSLLCTFTFGTWAAKRRHAERIIIPTIDILQSVPVLGFLSITVVGFLVLFQGSLMGPECAAIFAILVAQVWNMILSFYQSLKTVPKALCEAAQMFQLSAWQRFWRIEVPFAMPGLLWNAMLSMSASWVFLVASEAITVAHQTITLPGIGSYIAVAIGQRNVSAIVAVIVAMCVVIALYDQLIFRPLVAWSEKFKIEETADPQPASSWLLNLFQRARFSQQLAAVIGYACDLLVNVRYLRRRHVVRASRAVLRWDRVLTVVWYGVLVVALAVGAVMLWRFIATTVSWSDLAHVFRLGCYTAIRVMTLIVLSALIWVPLGVRIGLSPMASKIVQPVAQFLAAFPVNLLFPIAVMAILHFHLNPNIWLSPLMILGTQWYILFNVVAGTMALPNNLHQAVGTLNVRGWLWWRRFILPGIFPYLITGAITAAGGAWNISILSEAVQWGQTILYADGLGAFITRASNHGAFPRLALGIVVMSLFVLVINRTVWKPLYQLAERRFQIR